MTPADRFEVTLDGLCRAVAARVVAGVMSTVMILLVWQRVRRVQVRFLRLLARFRQGRIVVRAASRGRVGGARRVGAGSGLPRRFGWLLPLVPSAAAGFAGQLRSVLAEDEMVALLEAAPQARRVLAPLCRMLGIEATLLSPQSRTGGGPGLDGEVAASGPVVAAGDREVARSGDPACAIAPPSETAAPSLDRRWRCCDDGADARAGDG